MEIQQRLLKCVTHINWILLAVSGIVSFGRFAPDVAWGIVVGGLIVTINFHLLYRTLKNAMGTSHFTSFKGILIKYYIRFVLSGGIIFILMIKQYVNPVGLLVGLSIVVVSITFATLFELKKIILKEAA